MTGATLSPMINTASLNTVGDLREHTHPVAAMLSSILTALASGKYNNEVALTEMVMMDLAKGFPPLGTAEKALEAFIFINKLTAPRGPVVPDGRGGYVPESNSRYDPKTGEFL